MTTLYWQRIARQSKYQRCLPWGNLQQRLGRRWRLWWWATQNRLILIVNRIYNLTERDVLYCTHTFFYAQEYQPTIQKGAARIMCQPAPQPSSPDLDVRWVCSSKCTRHWCTLSRNCSCTDLHHTHNRALSRQYWWQRGRIWFFVCGIIQFKGATASEDNSRIGEKTNPGNEAHFRMCPTVTKELLSHEICSRALHIRHLSIVDLRQRSKATNIQFVPRVRR